MFEAPGVLRGIHLLIFAIDFLEPPASISLFPPTFLSLAHWNDCDRGSAACLQFWWSQLLIPQKLELAHKEIPHHHHHLKGPWHRESCIIIREVVLHGGASGLDVGLLAGWKEQSVKAWAQPDRLIHLSFSLLQLSLTPQTVARPESLLLAFSLSFSLSSYAVVAPLPSFLISPCLFSAPFPSFSLLAGSGYLKWQTDFKTDAEVLLLFKHINAHTQQNRLKLP